ncbi:MAG: class II D-tagatose-bisphosphate aldolase, non-catalytic subunit [Candidatus Marsarchaeota archaeon]|nr:class II D-tagatose-bisphosphate aldolase, non-catalytic subunit [Candidatus Marsarchaeota archaeon]
MSMDEAVRSHVAAGRRIIGIGPMSPNCAEAIYSYSSRARTPIMLIASRRQIEAGPLGAGYVNGWTSETFCTHAKSLQARHPNHQVFICRDHGGPWQGYGEEKLPFEQAMERAKKSYESDILAGFDLLHLDPSLNLDGKATLARSIQAGFDLLVHCTEFAEKNGRKDKLFFEIGTEENVGKATSGEVFEEGLLKTLDFCRSHGIAPPIFVVGQTGSLVKEMRQVGEFDSETAARLARVSAEHGVLLKEHNADYLSHFQLRQRAEARVPALNVAPEFGVIESRAFVELAMKKGKPGLAEAFLQLAYDSGKWKKWVLDTSHISRYDIGLIAGHYVFSSPAFQKLRESLGAGEFDALARERLLERMDFYTNGA